MSKLSYKEKIEIYNKRKEGETLKTLQSKYGMTKHNIQYLVWLIDKQCYIIGLKNNGIKQSMSRKGNSMDNGMMENFFGILKTEMFYEQEDNYETLDDLIKAIDDYIYYYNYDRIKIKLKGLSPVNYRLQSSN